MTEITQEDILEAQEAFMPSADRPYKWVMLPGVKTPRAECREHGLIMKWAMKISKDYPVTVSKHTGPGKRWRVPIEYMGLLLQIWKCPAQGCEVEAVK